MVNFPASLDSLANPTATTKRNATGYELATVISTLNDIAEAVEAKVGIGASTSTDKTRLEGNGAGSSAWVKASRARAYKSAAVQTLANNTLTAISLDAEVYDTDTMHDNSTNNSRLTCKTAGVYVITGQINYAANATSVRDAFIYVNGAAVATARGRDPENAGAYIQVTTQYELAVNDYVQLYGYQVSGGDLNVTNGATLTWLAMARVG